MVGLFFKLFYSLNFWERWWLAFYEFENVDIKKDLGESRTHNPGVAVQSLNHLATRSDAVDRNRTCIAINAYFLSGEALYQLRHYSIRKV